ncbi:unnamed protein product [Closterium sp. Yama58-4]|nr:unnamed protein product [Closterium sp. Yama58-4]
MPSLAILHCFTCNAKDSHFPLSSFSPSSDSPLPSVSLLSAFSNFTIFHQMDALESKLLSRLNTQFQSLLRRLSPSPQCLPLRILTFHGIPSDGCPGEQKHWQEQSSPPLIPPLIPISAFLPFILPYSAFSHFTASIRWMPWRAEALARAVLGELAKELAGRPRPVVFMSFSGGYKACQWKIMEALLSTSAQESNHRDEGTAGAAAAALAPVPSSSSPPPSALPSKAQGEVSASHRHFLSLLRECYAGQVFDSSPVDFTSDLGVRFLSQPPPVTGQPQATSQPSIPAQPPSQKQGSSPASAGAPAAPATPVTAPALDSPATTRADSAASAVATAKQPSSLRHTLVRSAAVVLDWLLLPEFERQRAAQWTTLLHCSTLSPVLLLCSTDDQLAPIEFIHKYEREAEARGATVKRVEWSTSEHVGEWGGGG